MREPGSGEGQYLTAGGDPVWKTISVVVPCYNEVEAIPLFYREICRISDLMPEYVFEYVFVNDGSKDATLSRIKERPRPTAGSNTSPFPAILGKKRHVCGAFATPRGIMWRSWTRICRIRPPFCPR